MTVPDPEPGKLLRLVLPGRDVPVEDQPGTELEPAPEVLEGEIVEEEPEHPDGLLLVDQPTGATVWEPPWQRDSKRAPVVAPWLADRDERRQAVAWATRHVRHVVGFHAARSPVYAGRLLAASPRGAARTLAGATRWAGSAELTGLIATAHGDPKATARLVEIRQQQAARRMILLGLALVAVVAAWVLTGRTGIGWDRPVLLLATVVGFGIVGRRKDKPLIEHAVVAPQSAPRLTSEVVSLGLASIGVPALAKDGAIRFVAPITRDGPGWRADIDLPHGVTVTDVLDKRERLASGLRRPLGCVWPEAVPDEHEGRLALWVGDVAMNKAKAPPWPLAKTGQADIFKPLPFGHDQRGRLVTVPLIFESVLIGAKPRMGKTFSLRVLLLAAALDPIVEQRTWELKGTGDLDMIERVAYHYGSGADDETIENCMLSLREVHGLLVPRAKTISGLPKSVCPENKVTPELSRRRSLGLHPVLFSIDECQELFTHPEYGKEAERLCTDIIKRGPALGIILVLATQRPDKDSLPTAISANVGVRFCLRVMGQVENDMVLGTSSYRNGIRATTFTRSDKGIGHLVGASDDPEIVRTAYLDGPASARIADRARTLREAAGTLAGAAVGEQTFDRGPDFSVVTDLLSVMPEDREHSAELCARLADLRPSAYEGWDALTLATALSACGVKTKQVRAGDEGKNGRGVVRAHLVQAADARGLMT